MNAVRVSDRLEDPQNTGAEHIMRDGKPFPPEDVLRSASELLTHHSVIEVLLEIYDTESGEVEESSLLPDVDDDSCHCKFCKVAIAIALLCGEGMIKIQRRLGNRVYILTDEGRAIAGRIDRAVGP